MSLSKDNTKSFDRSSKKRHYLTIQRKEIRELNQKRSGKKKVVSKV